MSMESTEIKKIFVLSVFSVDMTSQMWMTR